MSYVIEQELCSCCHRCRTHCPVEAISFKGAKYWIDPDVCIDCGTCVTYCHNGCISNPELPEDTIPAHDKITETCDVCVIGGGGAGMIAANKAQDLGAKVIVLEKMHEVGGSSWYAAGFRTHWSKKHAEKGLEDQREAKYQEYLEKTAGNDVDEKLLKRYFKANEEFADWLFDEHRFGDDYEAGVGRMGPGPETIMFHPKRAWEDAEKRIDRMIGPGEIGSYMALHMQEDLKAGGGKILLKTSAKHLLTNPDGSIRGVLAEDSGGEIEIACKAVIVASGAFSRNKELMSKFQPIFYDNKGKEPVHIFTGAGCTGDGITMCDEIGADIDYVNKRVNLFGPMRHPYPAASMSIYQSHDGFEITSDGQPFQGRMGQEVSSMTKTAGWYGWKIVDEKIAETAVKEALEEPEQSKGMNLHGFIRDWKKHLAEEEKDNAVVIADSVEELAKKLGVDADALQKQVAEYNAHTTEPREFPPDFPEFMRPKHDPIAVETAPFYALKMKMFHENAIGGMTINENAQVLKKGVPIPGLYAAGDTTRGIIISGDVGVDYVESVFTALTQAYDEGYIAGEEAAEFIKGN